MLTSISGICSIPVIINLEMFVDKHSSLFVDYLLDS